MILIDMLSQSYPPWSVARGKGDLIGFSILDLYPGFSIPVFTKTVKPHLTTGKWLHPWPWSPKREARAGMHIKSPCIQPKGKGFQKTLSTWITWTHFLS
jgi:hypothetical protein